MANNTRMVRINDEIMREVANIIRSDIKDPRIGAMASVIKTETTNDLSYTKVYVSVFGDETQKKEAMTILKNASGFIRKEIARRINLRNTPEFKFILDESIEYSARINEIIKEIGESHNDKEDE